MKNQEFYEITDRFMNDTVNELKKGIPLEGFLYKVNDSTIMITLVDGLAKYKCYLDIFGKNRKLFDNLYLSLINFIIKKYTDKFDIKKNNPILSYPVMKIHKEDGTVYDFPLAISVDDLINIGIIDTELNPWLEKPSLCIKDDGNYKSNIYEELKESIPDIPNFLMNYEKEDFDAFDQLFSKYPLSLGLGSFTPNSDLSIIIDFINAMVKFYCDKLNITANIYFRFDIRECYVGSGASRYRTLPKEPIPVSVKLAVNNKSILVY